AGPVSGLNAFPVGFAGFAGECGADVAVHDVEFVDCDLVWTGCLHGDEVEGVELGPGFVPVHVPIPRLLNEIPELDDVLTEPARGSIRGCLQVRSRRAAVDVEPCTNRHTL